MRAQSDQGNFKQKLLWFVGLWGASVVALGLVGWAIRGVLGI